MPWLTRRTIILDHDAEAELKAAGVEFARFEDAWEGVEWLLSRNPTPEGSFLSMTDAEGVDYWIFGFRGDREAEIPDMWIFYSWDEDNIFVHGINANEAPSPDDEEVVE